MTVPTGGENGAKRTSLRAKRGKLMNVSYQHDATSPPLPGRLG